MLSQIRSILTLNVVFMEICFNDFDVDAARLPLAGVELKVRGSVPSITVPRVELHEVVVVDLKS